MIFRKKKGFTIIELLAVIVILAIIMVIIVPEVFKTIEKSRKKSFETSIKGLMHALETKQKELMLDDFNGELIFTYEKGIESSNIQGLSLSYNGEKPQDGMIAIDVDGNISLLIYNGIYCAEKSFDNDEIEIEECELDECIVEDNNNE